MQKMTSSMYEMLKKSLNEKRTGDSFKDILKTEIGKTYTVRLVPNIESLEKSTHKYFSHTWKSLATGNNVSCVCPTTHGERCSICEERIRLYRTEDEKNKENAKLLTRKEQWLINAYVIDDPTNPKNNGTVKILRYGKQLDDIINQAVDGDRSSEIGVGRVFNLGADGCNLKIKVDKNKGGYADYTKSWFSNASEIPGMNEAKEEQIFKSLFKLDEVFDKKTPEEVDLMLETHYKCNLAPSAPARSSSNSEASSQESKAAGTTADKSEAPVSDESDQRVKDLLKDLD